ncbi:MAG: bi-domain-containing oxidoreductase [Candidatus Marinimicrobia bacterium]|nr:bi-domain-containing oxidoreductase [Candidatus Neomarinimicrobiota bacterium]
MKQILQNLKTGKTQLVKLPVPKVQPGCILIKTTHSLVSLGTERMLVEFGKANLINKARQQPDKVKQVLDKIRSDGLIPTISAVQSKIDQSLPLGYCNVGEVIAVGKGVSGLQVGDQVASNGPHAEIVCVPENLVAKIPENVTNEDATFTVIGSIGLQGIRLLNPTLGETIAVIGLGLIGLITCQLLKANGCNVIGIDLDQSKCSIAEKRGTKTINPTKCDPVKAVLDLTDVGADGVLITASTKSNAVISQAAQMSRKRGRIVLVGVVDLDIKRTDFYEKELSFQVSCSYGPGRYDENYERNGNDYPIAYVRWTEKRNFETVLKAISNGSLYVKDLITEKFPLSDYHQIYDRISFSNSIASILVYPNHAKDFFKQNTIKLKETSFAGQKCVVGIIGAGNFTKMTVLPALKNTGANLKFIASSGGMNGTLLAKKYGFSHSTTDYKEILNDRDVDTVIITTRHNLHAKFIVEALLSGKNVFVEKPLAINEMQLEEIISTYHKVEHPSLMLGFNRRFSPHIQAIKKSLGKIPGLINLVATMNAGFIPKDHWVHDLETGGGRIIGEACHYMDLCVFLTGSEIKSICMNAMGKSTEVNTDNASILLRFKNGSNATINYFANGSKSYSKERIEVYSQERTWIVDNFKTTKAFNVKGFKNIKTKIDKGHKAQFHKYIKIIKNGGKPMIPINEIINVTQASFAAIESMKNNKWIDIT